MKNDSARNGDGGALVPRHGKGNNGIIPNSYKAFSNYLRIVSSGASTVASTVRSAASAASSIVERDNETNHDQVSWAGFDNLELEKGISRRVLLLGYSYGFQVWDVEFADNVRNLVSRHDGPVSFMQMLPRPLASKPNKFSESHPLLIICADGSFSGGDSEQDGSSIFSTGSTQQSHGSSINSTCTPTVVWFYSLKSQSYLHLLRFRSVVYLVRCSPRVVAILQSNQIHCFNAATLEREYTIVTNPVVTGCYGSGNIGFGPLAVGPRWMAYSGSQVAISNSGRVNPQHLNPSASFPCSSSNGSLFAHYAKESSKQLAAGIITLGDIGYKKLSRYYSELLPEGNSCQSGETHVKVYGVGNGHSPHGDDVGMVIVRDIVSKTVIAQFRAHKSPILSLCFDPSGILLVTASVQGHNINVFRIMPELSEGSSASASGPSYVHIYRLQRGFTNAIIQDISFSSDSKWIMISSSRGTSHLFAISASGGPVNYQSTDANFSSNRNNERRSIIKNDVHGSSNSRLQVLIQQSVCSSSGPPITLSAISRIRNGNNSWKNTATGRTNSLSGAIASSFHNCKGNNINADNISLERSYYLLVFSPSGSVIQYALRISPAFNGVTALSGVGPAFESDHDSDARLVVEATQKWNICQKQNRRERPDNVDLYGENGNSISRKVYPERTEQTDGSFSNVMGTTKKGKVTTDENNHMYISAAELQMHQNSHPLWARSEIYFQSMLTDGYNLEGGDSGGEIEIERIPVRTHEARSGDLIPVFDYLQAPKHQEGRIGRRSSSGSLDSIANGGLVVNELLNNVDENEQDGLRLTSEMNRATVNTHDTPTTESTLLENVNVRDNSVKESELKSVHNNRDGPEIKNQSAEGDTDFG